ncbi:MAG: CDP-alcohol phosphatidyltransferase family protein [Candidatus Babeliales bacterium]|nr:CDP-alcohol phosphatidyltransferase family protein [Candidatus Babeliales bacterium]
MKFNLSSFKKWPAREKKLTLSTQITLFRIFIIPFIVFAIVNQYWGIVFSLVVLGAISDVADGKIARARNEITALGTCLDPVADKLLVLSCYLALANTDTTFLSIPVWFFWLVLFKEFVLIIGGIIFYYLKGNIVQPEFVGKSAMALQIIFIAWLSACYYFNWHPYITYNVMLVSVIVFVVASLLQYFKIGLTQLISKKTFLILMVFPILGQDNEFVLPKKKENVSTAKLKDSIVKKFGDILHANITLDEVSLELRKFTLVQTESGIKDENSCLSKANNDELKAILDELKKLEDELNSNYKSLKNKLSKLKKKFNIN